MLLSADGKVHCLNPEARRLLETTDGVFLSSGILNYSAVFGGEGVLRVPRPSGKSDYVVWTTCMLNGGDRPAYRLITIFDPTRREENIRNLIIAAFRLTPAEFRLAEQVLTGASPRQAAEALGVTIHTVRTYLKRLYHKAGVKTQAGLVRALLKAVENVPTGW